MTDHTMTASNFYAAMPTDVLIRIRTSHIDNLGTMNAILEERGLVLDSRGREFYLTSEEDEIFAGSTEDEALNFIIAATEY